MKQLLTVFLIVTAIVNSLIADENLNFDEMSFGIGKSIDGDDTKIFRVSVKEHFDKNSLYETKYGELNWYVEGAYNYWHCDAGHASIISLSPVLKYNIVYNGDLKPYLEAGIGAAYLTNRSVVQNRLSTKFQFEDRFGIGIEKENIDINLRYLHYSNGGGEKPNSGMNYLNLSISIPF